jgi:DNA-binding GntR family transcriptional regulator
MHRNATQIARGRQTVRSASEPASAHPTQYEGAATATHPKGQTDANVFDLWVSSQVPRPFEPAYEFVNRVLRRAVLDGLLPGGRRLLQSEVATQLSVSTTPVREALHRLASEGLIDTVPGRGAVVHTLSLGEWSEIVAMRSLLEPYALRLAADRIEGRALAHMEQIQRDMTTEQDIATWVDLNRQFHRVYYEAAESPRLLAVLASLQDAATTYVAQGVREHPELPQRGNQEHAGIIKGLRERDTAGLEKLIVEHITTTLTLLHRSGAG